MTMPPTSRGPRATNRGALPPAVYAVALAMMLLHVLPHLVAQATTPEGWHFTGNVQASPDLMQYRQWFRQSRLDGPLIRDMFTAEPNRPHLLVLVAWTVGTTAAALNVAPEFVYAYGGAVLAFFFTLLLYRVVAAFVDDPVQRAWTFAALFGGGVGGYLRGLTSLVAVARAAAPGVRAVLPPAPAFLFEQYRGHFIVTAISDTHELVNWTLATASVLALYRYFRHPSASRLTFACVLAMVTTLVHIYTGFVVAAATACIVAILCQRRMVPMAVAVRGLSPAVVAGVLAVLQVGLVLQSGLPFPTWRGGAIYVTQLLLAYPLGFALTAWGLPRLLEDRSLEVAVLLGWLAACLGIALSHPLFPQPDRGTMSMQIPVTILGAIAWFRVYPTLTRRAFAAALVALISTPVYALNFKVTTAWFSTAAPAKFVSPDHQALAEAASRTSTADDLLISDERSLLWLAPDFHGRQFCGHFFLTVDYDRKCGELETFFLGTPEEQSRFLREQGATLLFVPRALDPVRFGRLPGVSVLESNGVGTLFRHAPPS